MPSFHYFKRDWEESTGEEATDSWGSSTYYFETDDEGNVLRQVQLFQNSNALKYDEDYLEDKLGGLSELPLDTTDTDFIKIPQTEFEQLWQSTHYRLFPEIVCTAEVLWGQPRLDGRRLAVGDIVSLINNYADDINTTLKDFNLSLLEVRQALHYCKSLRCKDDQPVKYCHNCLLRAKQENTTADANDPEQPNWLIAGTLFRRYFS